MDSIGKIKQVISSLEVQVEDKNAQTLELLLTDLGKENKDQGDAYTIVKMMQSIGRYLISRTSSAHPDSVALLSVLAGNLELFFSKPALHKGEAQEILAKSIKSFKALKSGIAASSTLSKVELEELKAVILSVDWEISSSTLKSFDSVIARLKEKMKSNKLHYTFLRIMHSIGGYIARNKAAVDTKSINLLQSVFLNYEKLNQNPGMLPEEKKQIIEGDIRAYNKFKGGIAGWEQTDSAPIQEDAELPPALSHIDSAQAPEGVATLSRLSETSDGGEDVLPALAGKKKEAEPPRDVMGDLFSPKTTPADELLDAIHLAELHGSGEQNPAGMMDTAQGKEDSPGVKQFVPERGGGTPIPEIESRLDEFFNLDTSENSITQLSEVESEETETAEPLYPSEITDDAEFEPIPEPIIPEQIIAEPVSELEPTPEAEPIPAFEKEMESISEYPFEPESDLTMEMVPDDGIELIEPVGYQEKEDIEQSFLVEDLKEDPADSVLGRLKTILSEPSDLSGDTNFTQAREDLSQLSQLWENQMEKITLIELLTGLTRYIHELKDTATQEDSLESMSDGAHVIVSDDPLEGEVQETLFGEDVLPSEDEDLSVDEVGLEEDPLTDGNGLSDDETQQEDVRAENSLDVEETPKGFWGKIKSKFRK